MGMTTHAMPLLLFLCLRPLAGLEFSTPQVVGGGGGASGFVGLDTDAGRLVAGAAEAAAAAVSVTSLNGSSPWAPQLRANKSWPGTWPFPSECHSCRTMETLGNLDAVTNETATVLTSSGGYTCLLYTSPSPRDS